MKPSAPFGFYVAGCFSAWFGAMLLIALVSMDAPGANQWNGLLGRGSVALLAALAAVVTEALWRARPWVWRASLALALAYVAVVLAAFTGSDRGGIEVAVGVLAGSSTVLVPLLMYIRHRSRRLWPPAPRAASHARARISVPPSAPPATTPGTGFGP